MSDLIRTERIGSLLRAVALMTEHAKSRRTEARAMYAAGYIDLEQHNGLCRYAAEVASDALRLDAMVVELASWRGGT